MRRASSERRYLLAAAVAAGLAASGPVARAAEGGARGGEAEAEGPSPEVREEGDRVFLGGDAPGSIAKPLRLTDEASAGKLCDALQGPRRAPKESEAYQAPKKKELREQQRVALRNVYEVVVAPGGFHAAPYRPERGVLPLRVDRGLVALDGAVTLQIMKRKGADLELPPDQAKAIAQGIEDKKLALRVTFRPDADDAEHLSPCFSPAQSASYVLRVEPLAYELIDVATAKRVAASDTPARKELDRFVQPGPAELSTSVQVEGGLDPEALARALDGRRDELASCLQPVMSSRGGTGVLGYGVNVLPSGALDDVHLEVDALSAPDASACVGKIISGLSVPKGARASRAHLTVTVERRPAGAKEPEVVRGASN